MGESHFQILEESETVEGSRLSLLARQWFAALRAPLNDTRSDAAFRLGHALSAHCAELGTNLESVKILNRSEGLAWLKDPPQDYIRWHQALRDRSEVIRDVALRSRLHESQPIFMISGDAILIRAEELPFSHSAFLTRIAKPDSEPWLKDLAQTQLDDLLTICGWSLAAAGCPQPELGLAFESLVPVYEEGLLPLGVVDANHFYLWLP
jgi:hypothetical protein